MEFDPPRAPQCDCGHCAGKKPIEALYFAESLLRQRLSGIFLDAQELPVITEQDRKDINRLMAQVNRIAKLFRREVDWIEIFNATHTIVGEATA